MYTNILTVASFEPGLDFVIVFFSFFPLSLSLLLSISFLHFNETSTEFCIKLRKRESSRWVEITLCLRAKRKGCTIQWCKSCCPVQTTKLKVIYLVLCTYIQIYFDTNILYDTCYGLNTRMWLAKISNFIATFLSAK